MAAEFRVSYHKIRSHRRHGPQVTLARDELCRRLKDVGYSYNEIGAFLCGRTHCSIIAAVRRARVRFVAILMAA